VLVPTLGRLVALSVVGVTLAAAGSATSAPAPPPTDEAAWKVSRAICWVRGDRVDVGGQVVLQERRAQVVDQVLVTWLLHTRSDPTWTTAPYRWRTEASMRFPDEARPHEYVSEVQRWQNLEMPDDGFTLIAELTWKRSDGPDWEHRVVVTHCP